MVSISIGLNDPAVCPSPEPVIGFASNILDGGGWSWTLTSRLGQLLRDAECEFGPRDPAFIPIGIEFGGGRPCTWFPGNCGHIAIRLTENAMTSRSRAFYQLAHEVIHLLGPRPGIVACNFEEGLATHYSDRQCANLGIRFSSDIAAYELARASVEGILERDPSMVRRAREERPSMFDWTGDFLALYIKDTPRAELDWLCKPFEG